MHRLLTEVQRSRLGPSSTVHRFLLYTPCSLPFTEGSELFSTPRSQRLSRCSQLPLSSLTSSEYGSHLSSPAIVSVHLRLHLPVWHGLVSSVALMLPPRASCYMYSSRMRRYVTPPVWYSSRMLLLPYAHACMPACSSSSDAHLALLLLGGRLGRPDRRAARKDALMQLVQNAATAAAALGGRRRRRGVPSAVPSALRRTHRLEDRRLECLHRRPV